MSRALTLCVATILAAAAAGCGTSADREDARAAAAGIYAAAHAHDGTRACAEMSPALRRALVDQEDPGAGCAKALDDLDLDEGDGAPAVVEVYADEARVRFGDGGDTVFLSLTSEGWRADAIGCRPQGAGPYDCEAEA
jgi:hypothetical protein